MASPILWQNKAQTVTLLDVPRSIAAAQSTLLQHESSPETYDGGAGAYWDDACLAWFLEGVCCRFLAYPVFYPTLLTSQSFLTADG